METRGTVAELTIVGRGQEFVLNCTVYPEAVGWAIQMITSSVGVARNRRREDAQTDSKKKNARPHARSSGRRQAPATDEHAQSRKGEYFDPRRDGRLMKE